VQKVIIGLLTLMLSLTSFCAEEFSPQHTGAIEGLNCVLDNYLGPDGCSGESLTCEESTSDIEYFHNFPFSSCVRAICDNYPQDLRSLSVARDERMEVYAQVIKDDVAPLASNLYETLKTKANEAKSYLESNPAIAEELNKTKTISDLQERLARIATQGLEEGELRPKASILRDHLLHFPGWGEDLVSLNYDLLKLMRQKMSGQNQFEAVSRELVQADSRRLLVGRLEQRVRALPGSITEKQDLLNRVFDLQSANQFDGPVPNEFNLSVYSLLTDLVVFETLHSDQELLAYKNIIFAKAQEREIVSEPQLFEALINGQDKESFVDFCVQNIAFQAQSFPSRVERLALIDGIRNTKENIKRRVLGSFSRETRGGVSRAIDSTEVAVPPAREDYLERMKGILSEKRGVHNALGPMDSLSASIHYSQFNGSSLARNLCSLPFYVDDGASALTTPVEGVRGQKDQHHLVSIGNHFCEGYHQFGEHVFAHELGHVVSKHVQEFASRESKKALKNSMDCLNTNQSGGSVEKFFGFIGGDELAHGLKEEEDFADLFAFLTIPTSQNPKCSFFNNGQPVSGMVNSIYSSDETPHSSDLYRLLHGEVAKNGRIPDACRVDLQANGQEFREKNCWKNAPARVR
jgi:hypothetical protein